MENAEKKSRENCLNDSSNELAEWLFKYKLENISYLSSPPVVPVTNKTPRKGSTGLQPFDYRDIIRPTVQLFKNIKPKTKKRNDASPSPQRKKVYITTSPTKETNKIFNHKVSCEDTLDNYRKVYTYARVKQDKVSREKIESAVALYRQREQEKESSSTAIKNLPEKRKKSEQSDKQSNKGEKKFKNVRFQDKIRKDSRNSSINQKLDNQSNAATKIAQSEERINKTSDIKKDKALGITVHSREKTNKSNLSVKTASDLIITDFTMKNINIQGEKQIKEEMNGIKVSDKMKNIVNEDANFEPKKLNLLLANKEDKIFSKINRPDKIDISNPISKRYLTNSYNFKNKKDTLEISGNLPVILTRRNVHMQLRNYISIKPALQEGNTTNSYQKDKSINIGKTKSIDDLLQEYRLKYRNMIKLK